MCDGRHVRLQTIVFALVSAAFTHIYLTQPVLPVLREEFAADTLSVSFTVSAVILGIALANLPFGFLADRWPIRPIVLTGGVCVALGALVCALTGSLGVLIGARFFQGIFIPPLTSCLAAHLARTLPQERLRVVMGAYVSATVLGGLGGRLLGGWLHPPLHWRYAFVSAAVLILGATLAAYRFLPPSAAKAPPPSRAEGFMRLLLRPDLVRIFFCAAGAFAIFSTVFNYLPFRLASPPFHFSTQMTTLLYLVYIVGILLGPLIGRLSNRFGSGPTLLCGSLLLGIALAALLLPSIAAVVAGLLGLCAGFFTVHSAAVGALNCRLSSGQGRANALYVLFYYAGGWIGITCSGIVYELSGWKAVIGLCALILAVPFGAGIAQSRSERVEIRP